MTYPLQPGPPGPQQPPGYPAGAPQQLPPQQYFSQPLPPPAPKGHSAAWGLGLCSVLLVVLGLSLKEDGSNAWHSVHAWGGLAIAGAVLTLATVAGSSVGIRPPRSWQVAVAGAAGLVLYWVLFVLPSVGSNTSLLTTLGVAAGVGAVWVAPGRAAPGPQAW